MQAWQSSHPVRFWRDRDGIMSWFLSSFSVADSFLSAFVLRGVALLALGGALGLVLVARSAPLFCVASVTQGIMHCDFPMVDIACSD
jgi:hypothetical protein